MKKEVDPTKHASARKTQHRYDYADEGFQSTLTRKENRNSLATVTRQSKKVPRKIADIHQTHSPINPKSKNFTLRLAREKVQNNRLKNASK